MRRERFAGVWDAIEDAPGQAEAMKLRPALMMALNEIVLPELDCVCFRPLGCSA